MPRPRREWTPAEVARLGVDSDVAIARDLGISPVTVIKERQRRGIAASPHTGGIAPRAGLVADTRITLRVAEHELAEWTEAAGDQAIGAWIRDVVSAHVRRKR